jgi:hypothetical protein
MDTNFKYEWGQEVRVAVSAPEAMHPGHKGSVCGMRERYPCNLYLVEFSDGSATEIPEDLLSLE